MVKLYVFLLLCFSSIINAAELNVVFSDSKVELGKQLSAKIVYTGHSPKLADLTLWENAFHIERLETETERLQTGEVQFTEHIKLYPRKAGKLVLDGIASGGAFTKSFTINANKSIRKNTDLSAYWHTKPKTVWQNALFSVSVKINLLVKSNHIYISDELIKGFKIHQFKKTPLLKGNRHAVLLTWYLTATKTGNNEIVLPLIEQRGKGRWQYYLEKRRLLIKPLPSYFPSTVPIGLTRLITQTVTINNKQHYLIQVKNNGILLTEVFGLRKQIAKLVSSNITAVSVTAPVINQTGVSTQNYQVAVPKWSVGFNKTLKLVYFDTNKGQLANKQFVINKVWRVPLWAKLVITIVLLFFMFLIVKNASPLFKAYKTHTQTIASIKKCQNAEAIRAVLKKSLPYTMDKNITAQINEACFAKQKSVNVQRLKQQVLVNIKLKNIIRDLCTNSSYLVKMV